MIRVKVGNMDIQPLGKTLGIARESVVTLIAGDITLNFSCTPENLRELAIGFLVSEGLVTDTKIGVSVDDTKIYVTSVNLRRDFDNNSFRIRSSGVPGVSAETLPVVKVGETFDLSECRKAPRRD